jgi:hypothetical protein
VSLFLTPGKAEAPFANGENKKFEFTDAFAIQALGEWADLNDLDMFVVSADKLFREGCKPFDRLYPKGSLSEVLNHVASDDENLANFLRSEILKHKDEIEERAAEEFEGYYLWVEDENGEAEVHDTRLTAEGEPEIIDINTEQAVLQIKFNPVYKARLHYEDSATASYDSEDGRLIYVQDRIEEVQREQKLIVEVSVDFDRREPGRLKIADISLTHPSDGLGIEIERNYGYPWK